MKTFIQHGDMLTVPAPLVEQYRASCTRSAPSLASPQPLVTEGSPSS